MLINTYEYLTPMNLQEALEALQRYDGRAALLAGGTDLIPEMKQGKRGPEYIVDLKHVPDLDRIGEDGDVLRIGALTKLRTIETSPLVRKYCHLLAQAASYVGSVQIRNRATLGGNICHASPSADTVPALLVLGSRVRIQGLAGERQEPIETFFLGPGITALRDGEILTEIIVPKQLKLESGVYIKHSIRKAMDLAIVGVAAIVRADEDGTATFVKLGLGAVAPTPIRARKAELLLEKQRLAEPIIRKAAQVAVEEIRPISDIRGSAEYRTEITRVLVRRAVTEAAQAVSLI